ncbi:pseudaminic acid synthase [Candidatus Pacearchaeota archaeon]|nr:pseudaminic acid synthase [Candidatus Pacearchaeota archaeon]
MKTFTIPTPKGNRTIGEGQPVFLIGDMSANHNQNFDTAVEIIKIAAEAGLDAIKLQSYLPNTITMDCNKDWFIIKNKDNPDIWKSKSLYQLYQQAFTPREWIPKLKELADQLGIVLFSTPFSVDDLNYLETTLNPPLYKIASYEVTHIPLLKEVARTGKPVILSTGFATADEIELAVKTLRENGTLNLVLLHCVTAYSSEPKPEQTNLNTMLDAGKRFNVTIGFSDNNAGIEIPLQAAMMGATVIEKHVVADNSKSEALDGKFSLDSQELKKFVKSVKRAEKTRGKVNYGPQSETEKANAHYRQSIFVVKNIKANEQFSSDNLKVIRPANGLAAKYYEDVLGKAAKQDIEKGTPLNWGFIF